MTRQASVMTDEIACPDCRHPAFLLPDGSYACVTCRRLCTDGLEWHPDEWPPCPWPAAGLPCHRCGLTALVFSDHGEE